MPGTTGPTRVTPREFVNLSRAKGHPTIAAAVDAYVVEIPGLHRAWPGLNAEEVGRSAMC